jgi:hypothetical protein
VCWLAVLQSAGHATLLKHNIEVHKAAPLEAGVLQVWHTTPAPHLYGTLWSAALGQLLVCMRRAIDHYMDAVGQTGRRWSLHLWHPPALRAPSHDSRVAAVALWTLASSCALCRPKHCIYSVCTTAAAARVNTHGATSVLCSGAHLNGAHCTCAR